MKKRYLVLICLSLLLIVFILFLLNNNLEKDENSKGDITNNIVIDLDFVYKHEVTRKFKDIRLLTKDYTIKEAELDGCYVRRLGNNSNNFGEQASNFKNDYENKKSAFIRGVDSTFEGDLLIVDSLYDNVLNKIVVVTDYTRDKFAVDGNTISVHVYEKLDTYASNGRIYLVAYNGELNDKNLHSENATIIGIIGNFYISSYSAKGIDLDYIYRAKEAKEYGDIRQIPSSYSLYDVKNDVSFIKGVSDKTFCLNKMDYFLKDYEDKKSSFLRIVSIEEEGTLIEDIYYDSNLVL